MHPGYLASGLGSPFQNDAWVEIINNRRAYAYALNAGIGWLNDCSTCAVTDPVVPGAPDGGFVSPAADSAPWYDPDNPDSWGFYGVVGIEVTGDDDSTRSATITQATTIGGIIGPVHYGVRTLVFRVLVVAADECSLQFGLNWLREVCAFEATPCSGDSLTFFDCCPCMCDEAGAGLGGPCWVHTYRELGSDPDACDPDWWPSTYLELRTGPVASTTDWCAWVERYAALKVGPRDFVCCLDECIVPYMRQFHNTVVTDGPTLLSRPEMSTGALAEVEFTITCGDPVPYALPILVGAAAVTSSVPVAADAVRADPFDRRPRSPLVLATRPAAAPPDGGWVRHEQEASPSAFGVLMSGQRLSFRLRTGTRPAERVRVGVWQGDERVAGYLVPYVPERATVIIDGARRTVEAEYDVNSRRLGGFVKDWDGGPARWPNLSHSGYRITIDQESGKDVQMVVTATATPVGST